MIWIQLKSFCSRWVILVIRCTPAKLPRNQLVSGREIQAVLSIFNHVYFHWNLNRKVAVTFLSPCNHNEYIYIYNINIHPRNHGGLSKFRTVFPTFMSNISGIIQPIQYSWHPENYRLGSIQRVWLSKFRAIKISHYGLLHILSKLNGIDMI